MVATIDSIEERIKRTERMLQLYLTWALGKSGQFSLSGGMTEQERSELIELMSRKD